METGFFPVWTVSSPCQLNAANRVSIFIKGLRGGDRERLVPTSGYKVCLFLPALQQASCVVEYSTNFK